MRIACCQFAPLFCQRLSNFEKARSLLSSSPLSQSKCDLLLFPEMAFVGYMFDNKQEIEPYMEDEKGPTFQFCKEMAIKYNSYVAAGYPRLGQKENNEKAFYNSMCFVSPSGELVATYDKSFLYETDHNWAVEGSGFVTLDIPEWKKKIGLGICMDINPYEYKDSSLYEFANYHKKNKTDLIIFCANWLDSDIKDNGSAFSTHSYWANRLGPLIKTNCTFVACNRIGKEKTATFCGGSCVISLKKPSLDAALKKRDEGVLIHDL